MDIVDFHAHILPKCDHGSSSVNMSLEQLAYAKNHGVTRVVATPHFYPHRENVQSFLERRDACYKRLSEAIEQSGQELPKVKLGAEVLICDNIEELPDISKLCLEGTNTLLLELPFNDFSHSFVKSVKRLVRGGYNIVLAHADRYKPENIEQLLGVGAKIQLNADPLCRLFVKKHLIDWIKKGFAVALGSDIHKTDKKAYKRFARSIKRMGVKNAELIKARSDYMFAAL